MTTRQLILVGGPNGSGKTTFSMEDLARHGGVYFGADAIAAELSPANPAAAAIEAGRLFLQRIEAALHAEQRLVVESTISGKSLAKFLKRAKQNSYHITIQYVFLGSPDECVARVRQRVGKGGHDVPEDDIRRRYWRSLHNFWNLYRELADDWVVIYNQLEQPEIVAVGDTEQTIHLNTDLYIQFRLLVEQSKNERPEANS